MKIEANCKINIGLDVLRRRDDGYHDLQTVMLPVAGLYDVVEVNRVDDCEVRFVQRGLVVDCPEEKNICIKAFRLMQSRYGVSGVEITLDKRVPFGAGLGGGSADGTAVVVAINTLFDLKLSEQELIDCAAMLGSDTPFFVKNCPQLCQGRGEILSPVELSLDGLWLVVVKPDEGVSTAEAYAGVTPSIPSVPLVERLSLPIEEWQACVKNDFEKSVFLSHPRIARIKESLREQGAVYASMSGSGSACFGLFRDETAARRYTPPFDGVFVHCERGR